MRGTHRPNRAAASTAAAGGGVKAPAAATVGRIRGAMARAATSPGATAGPATRPSGAAKDHGAIPGATNHDAMNHDAMNRDARSPGAKPRSPPYRTGTLPAQSRMKASVPERTAICRRGSAASAVRGAAGVAGAAVAVAVAATPSLGGDVGAGMGGGDPEHFQPAGQQASMEYSWGSDAGVEAARPADRPHASSAPPAERPASASAPEAHSAGESRPYVVWSSAPPTAAPAPLEERREE